MKPSVDKTLELLTETPNEAAVTVLLSGLDSTNTDLREGSLVALLTRRGNLGQQELIRRWNTLDDRLRSIIVDHPRQISSAVRHAILSRDVQHCSNGCKALLQIREYELIPALVAAASDAGNPQASLAAGTLVTLSEMLYEEIAGPRAAGRRQDPGRVQKEILPRLQRAVDHYDTHRQPEIMEAFLLLVPQNNELLRKILDEPRHPAYLDLMDILRKTTRIGSIRLMLNFLSERFAPSAVLQIVARRADLLFARQLLRRVTCPISEAMGTNFRRIDSIAWLQDDLELFAEFDGNEQRAAVEMAMASGINRLKVFNVLKHILETGKTEGRRAASAALAEFGGVEACQLTVAGLEDPDPEVQANMVLQFRERGVPGAISRLISLLDDPAPVVRQAAQKSLREFTFARYLSVFDMMDEDTRRSTGTLVMRIDPKAITQLRGELGAAARTRRLRALELAITMNAVSEVESHVVKLLGDDDHFVRAQAARALAYCDTTSARTSLRQALMDRSVAVRDAAEQALRRITGSVRRTAPSTLTSAIRDVESSPLVDGSMSTEMR